MNNQTLDTRHGHWILAKMGKRVLRPGGKELTLKLVENINIKPTDDVVEFAPGMGYTAGLVLKKQPKSYTGIELNVEASTLLQKIFTSENHKIINASASKTTLPDNSVDKVYGEAMLTMQSEKDKSSIVQEAYRILKKGGQYAIHELSLYPDELDNKMKREVQGGLIKSIKVNARPLTQKEWTEVLENVGFKVIKVVDNPMILLEFKRILDDEGLFRTLKIMFNILTHSEERRRILEMRGIFRKYKDNMRAITILAQK